MTKNYFFPVLLIIIGSLLLLNQFDLFEISRPHIFIASAFLIGILLLRKSFLSKERKGIIGGSFFILMGMILLSLDLGFIPYYDHLIIGLILVALGLTNFINYIFTRKSFNSITFGVVFCFLGLPFMIMYYGSFSMWDIADTFYTYWPILLITAGIGFLLDGLVKKAK